MTLRQRMLDDLPLRGFSPRTQEACVRAVRQLAAHFHRPPDQLGEDQLREYFLGLTRFGGHCSPEGEEASTDAQNTSTVST